MPIPTNTFVITLVASITDNKIDHVVVENIEMRTGEDHPLIKAAETKATETSQPLKTEGNHSPHRAEMFTSIDHIFADFKDGSGMQLVSIYDKRFCDFFIPCYKNGSNVRPAMGPKHIRSSREVRRYRIAGLALVKVLE